MLKFRCATCARISPLDEKVVVAGSDDIVVFACSCGVKYVAANTKKFKLPQLFKLTGTKSTLWEETNEQAAGNATE